MLVLAVALIEVRRGLARISEGLATLAAALQGVESEHLRPLEGAVKAINGAVRHHPRRAAGDRQQGGDRRREEAAMTLWWIGNVVLLAVVLPVVVYLLRGVLDAAKSIVPSVQEIAKRRGRGVEGPRRRRAAADDAGPGDQTVAGVANYGGSLDVILDDARIGGRWRRCWHSRQPAWSRSSPSC